jgi:hypothetical protein
MRDKSLRGETSTAKRSAALSLDSSTPHFKHDAPTRKRLKGRKDRTEAKVKRQVRAECVVRDGDCLVTRATHSGPVSACKGRVYVGTFRRPSSESDARDGPGAPARYAVQRHVVRAASRAGRKRYLASRLSQHRVRQRADQLGTTGAEGMTQRGTWKAAERRVAEDLGGQRIPVTGIDRDGADVVTPLFHCQVKLRKALPVWLWTWLAGIRGDATPAGRLGSWC